LASSAYYLSQKGILESKQKSLEAIREYFTYNNVSKDIVRVDFETNGMAGEKYGRLHQEIKNLQENFSVNANAIKWEATTRIDEKLGGLGLEIESLQSKYLNALFEEGNKSSNK